MRACYVTRDGECFHDVETDTPEEGWRIVEKMIRKRTTAMLGMKEESR